MYTVLSWDLCGREVVGFGMTPPYFWSKRQEILYKALDYNQVHKKQENPEIHPVLRFCRYTTNPP